MNKPSIQLKKLEKESKLNPSKEITDKTKTLIKKYRK